MTATAATPTQSPDRDNQADESRPTADAGPASAAGSQRDFQAALEAEVARRIDAVERRWQSRKDRELNRARRRWETEASQAIDPELLTWIAQADSRDVGQWLKAGLSDGESPLPDSTSDHASKPREASASEEAASSPAAETAEQPDQANTNRAADAEPVDQPIGTGRESESAVDPPPAVDPEDEAQARERLAERRSQDPAPDLFPSRGAPADAFHQIEAGFARGDVDLDTYETARRRRGLH